MADGNVTFRGSSTITRTRAVRPALPQAHALARTWSTSVRRWHWHWHEFFDLVPVLALALALLSHVVPSRQQFEQEYAVVVLVK
jgi:hypothetical protein